MAEGTEGYIGSGEIGLAHIIQGIEDLDLDTCWVERLEVIEFATGKENYFGALRVFQERRQDMLAHRTRPSEERCSVLFAHFVKSDQYFFGVLCLVLGGGKLEDFFLIEIFLQRVGKRKGYGP